LKRLIVLLLFAMPLVAQSSPPTTQGTFSLAASAVALPGGVQTVAGTLLGQTFAVANTVSLRATEVMAPGLSMNAFLGGVQWFPNLTKILAKTKISTSQFQPYLTCSGGEDTLSTGNHFAVTCGGGANYDPTNTGHFNVNLFEIQYARFPGATGSTAIISSGVRLTF
jgi:hypothetical protein